MDRNANDLDRQILINSMPTWYGILLSLSLMSNHQQEDLLFISRSTPNYKVRRVHMIRLLARAAHSARLTAVA